MHYCDCKSFLFILITSLTMIYLVTMFKWFTPKKQKKIVSILIFLIRQRQLYWIVTSYFLQGSSRKTRGKDENIKLQFTRSRVWFPDEAKLAYITRKIRERFTFCLYPVLRRSWGRTYCSVAPSATFSSCLISDCLRFLFSEKDAYIQIKKQIHKV